MHYKEITKIALEKGILETDGKILEVSMNVQITMDIKMKEEFLTLLKLHLLHLHLNLIKKKTLLLKLKKKIRKKRKRSKLLVALQEKLENI